MKELLFYVYLLTNQRNTVFYIGVTRDLIKRIYEHKNKLVKGFTQKYHLNKLVYFEQFSTPYEAITRKKQLKNWKRDWKIELIKKANPKLIDLYNQLLYRDSGLQAGMTNPYQTA